MNKALLVMILLIVFAVGVISGISGTAEYAVARSRDLVCTEVSK